MESKEYKFKFTVIIPIYNVEDYLEEAILSILNQTIGFKENIEIILVNDGSTDNCEQICKRYEMEYPKNIKYIYQENKGVCSARNKGMEFVQGKYVNFLDSDDKWDLDAFEKVYKFFEEHYNEIDVVACRQRFFEAKEGFHKLDYKFDRNHIVDILTDYKEIQLSMSSAFVKIDIMKLYQFDNRLQYSEDATLIGQILMQKSKYGILADVIYNYRKRNKETSALQTREGNKSWYFKTVEFGYKVLINKSIEKYGKVIPYIQYQIMYDIQWRINVDISLYLQDEEKKKYINNIIDLLSYIEDYIILEQKYIYREYKILALCLKYKKDIRKDFYFSDSKILYNDLKIYSIRNGSILKISEMLINSKKELIIKGKISSFLPKEDYNVFVKMGNGKKIPIKNTNCLYESDSIVGKLNNSDEFNISIPIENNNVDCKIILDYKSNKKKLGIIFGQLAKLSEENEELYFIEKNTLVTCKDSKIYIEKKVGNKIKVLEDNYNSYLKEIKREDLVLLRNKQRINTIKKIYIKFDKDEMYVLKTIRKWNDKFIDKAKWQKIEELSIQKEYILNSKVIVGNEKNVKNIFLDDEKYVKDLYNFKFIKNECVKVRI